jgi:hypothetical protein
MGIVFVVVGIGLLIAGAVSSSNATKAREEYPTIDATVVEVWERTGRRGAKSYDVYVSYTYNNQQYPKIEIDGGNSTMLPGDILTLYINPDDPTEVTTGEGSGPFFFILGGIFVVMGAGVALFFFRKLKGPSDSPVPAESFTAPTYAPNNGQGFAQPGFSGQTPDPAAAQSYGQQPGQGMPQAQQFNQGPAQGFGPQSGQGQLPAQGQQLPAQSFGQGFNQGQPQTIAGQGYNPTSAPGQPGLQQPGSQHLGQPGTQQSGQPSQPPAGGNYGSSNYQQPNYGPGSYGPTGQG